MLLGNQTGANYGFSKVAISPNVAPTTPLNNYVSSAPIPVAAPAPIAPRPAVKQPSQAHNYGQLTTTPGGQYVGFGLYRPAPVAAPAPVVQAEPELDYSSSIFSDPFSTAMSGNEKYTLQPYINRMTQNASNALYGGLMDYKPQSMVAGNAGGTPINSTVPNWHLPSAIPTQSGLLSPEVKEKLKGLFSNRSWMRS